MAARFYSWAWAQPVGAHAQHVLLYLADKADQAGRCWPSVRTIAEATRLSVATVRRALAELEDHGQIARQRRHRPADGTRTSDLITLSLALTVSSRDAEPSAHTDAPSAPTDAPSAPTEHADPLREPRREPVVLARARANGKAEHEPDGWMRPGQPPAKWLAEARARGGTDANVAAHLALAEQLRDRPAF